MLQYRSTTRIFRSGLLGLGLSALLLTGCDTVDGGGDGDVTIRGRVTNEAGFGKTAAVVEGAVVTASNVSAEGTLTRLDGQATTNAEGRFALDVDGAGDVVVAAAEKASFHTRALVYTAGRAAVDAMPMTTETAAEADVYVEAKKTDDDDAVTAADVVFYVSESLAAEIATGATTAAQVAVALRAAAEAEADYARDRAGDDTYEDVQEEEMAALLRLQAGLSASSSASAEADAMTAYETALVEAYADAGVSADVQAQARQAARAAVNRFGSGLSSHARFVLQQQAALAASMATAGAVEARFRAAGASSTRLNALGQARSALLADLRAATTAAALANAQATFASHVETELASELSVNAVTLTAANAAIGVAKTTLDAAVTAAADGRAVAEAYATFYTSAHASAEQTLGTSGTAKAGLGASVLTLLSTR